MPTRNRRPSGGPRRGWCRDRRRLFDADRRRLWAFHTGSASRTSIEPLGAAGRDSAGQSPEFDERTSGCGKLSGLVSALPLFEMKERLQGEGPSKALYIHNAAKRASWRGGGTGR
jgi:hypothetical protein